MERSARACDQDLFDTQRPHIKFATIKRFKAFMDHNNKLLEYVAAAYVLYVGDIIKLMTVKGIKVTILVLIELKNSYSPPTSPSQTSRLELPGTGLLIDED